MISIFRRDKHKQKSKRTRPFSWNLDEPLLFLSREDPWSIRDALEGTLILGATGSGKSTGSGSAIGSAMLRAGFGGIVLTAKSGERRIWEDYCRAADRLDDLLIFGPGELLRFNFLDYEAKRPGAAGGLSENIVNLFSTVLEAAERGASASGGREDEGYWRRALRQLLRNCIDGLLLAGEKVSVPNLYRMVISAPTGRDQVASAEWRANSMCFRCLKAAEDRAQSRRQKLDFHLVADYFTVEYPNLSEKTRSVVVSTFTSLVDVLNRGILRDLFSADTNITPEAVETGKIILIDLPAKEFAEVGVFAQVLWKYVFQRVIERRDVFSSPRPVFLWADEAQHFVTSYDQQFQTTCRSARVATVLLSQNVSNFYAALGKGEAGKAEADSLFGNLNTKIFHANGDPVTNEWASSLIGRSRQTMASCNSTRRSDLWSSIWGTEESNDSSSGFNEVFEYEVQPGEFNRLRTGGPRNQRCVDSIIVRNGRLFRATNRVWLPVTFRQS